MELLAGGWHVLRRTTFEQRHRDGRWSAEQRETYDRGNGATILLHDRERATVLLTRQFRFPVHVNGHPDGVLLETAAGLRDDDDPETAIRREEGEDIEVVELPFATALHMIGTGEIADAETMLLQWAALSGPFAQAASSA